MGTAVERAYELTEYWDEKLRADLPSGADIFVRTHIGDDIDGGVRQADELLSKMDGRHLAGVHVLHGRVRRSGLQRGNDARAGVDGAAAG